jgi:hypothetical protein
VKKEPPPLRIFQGEKRPNRKIIRPYYKHPPPSTNTMGSRTPDNSLPDKNSPVLHLTHPTAREKAATWTLNCQNWGSALGLTSYLAREEYLTTVPLAKNGGITHWILVDSSLPPDTRPILASCESLRKRALVSKNGKIQEVITHGIGSVFCNPEFRGKGYAGRMLKELGPVLKDWQTKETHKECPFSILYSDIGKKFYTGYGWQPFPSTHSTLFPHLALFQEVSSTLGSGKTQQTLLGTQTLPIWHLLTRRITVAFPPNTHPTPETAKRLKYPDLDPLCKLDEEHIRHFQDSGKTQVAIIPDHDQMQWHHLREDFMTNKLFSRSPTTKGAIAGPDHARVWAIWTRSFYGPVDKPASGNALHILRLVIEDESKTEDNAKALKSILEIAQKEAAEWTLNHVELWNPTEYVQKLVEGTGLQHERVEREEESIASLMWYGEGEGKVDEIEWVGNEKYGWC